jgi:TolC family type I secretion outer membrane protein
VRRFAGLFLAFASCAGWTHAPDRVAPSTSPAPNVPWSPPANAVPPALPKAEVALPSGVAAGAPITLDQAIDAALTNNPDTRAAWLQARAAEALLGSARSAYLPEIDLGASVLQQRSASSSGSTATATSFGPSLTLNYLLFDFGGRAAQVEEARQTLIATSFAQNQTIQNVVLRVEQSYYAYLGAKALLASQEASLHERQTSFDAAKARHDAGVATIADVLQAQTALSQAELNRETFEGNLHTFEGSLSTAMGLSPTIRFTLGELATDVPLESTGGVVDELIARAAASRPDLAAARAGVERSRARVQEVRAQGLPSFNLTTSIASTTFRGGGNVTTQPYSAGIAMRFPLFTGYRNTYDIRAAEAQAQLAVEDARGLEQDIDLQVWTSYYAMQTAAQRVKTSRDLLAAAQQSADVARGRYRGGVGGILDLLTAEAALETARAQEVQARADWFLAMAQLAHDVGTLGPQPQQENK